MSNRKAHRRARSFRRQERSIAHYERRPFRGPAFWKKTLRREARRRAQQVLSQLIREVPHGVA